MSPEDTVPRVSHDTIQCTPYTVVHTPACHLYTYTPAPSASPFPVPVPPSAISRPTEATSLPPPRRRPGWARDTNHLAAASFYRYPIPSTRSKLIPYSSTVYTVTDTGAGPGPCRTVLTLFLQVMLQVYCTSEDTAPRPRRERFECVRRVDRVDEQPEAEEGVEPLPREAPRAPLLRRLWLEDSQHERRRDERRGNEMKRLGAGETGEGKGKDRGWRVAREGWG